MIDHNGETVLVGWSDHHILWIEAAMTLPRNERTAAYQDIADLTGRSLTAIQQKAYWIGEKRQKEQLRLDAARVRRIMVPVRWLPRNERPQMAKSQIAPISKAKLMGCR